MAPIKFEEQIKEKLEARRIEPSLEAWSKLSEQLEDKSIKRKRTYWSLSIAASIALVAVVLVKMYQATPEDKNLEIPAYSVEDKTNEEETDHKEQSITINNGESLASEELSSSSLLQDSIEEEPTVKDEFADKSLADTTPSPELYASAETSERPKPNESLILEQEPISSNEVIASEDEIQEVLKEVKQQNEESINKEADSLLKAAQKALLTKQNISSSTFIVDASQLLEEVEKEVEPSLKTKVYRVIEDGFKKVRTAVAQRNNK